MKQAVLRLATLGLIVGRIASAHATTIDFQAYATGTALTSLDGITFSLVGGPDSAGSPLIGYDDIPPRGLSNSTNPNYPTANILDFSFSAPVSGVSFYFNNYGDNGTSYYEAFNSAGTRLESGNVSSDLGYANVVLTASGIKDLQFNNGYPSSESWYFVVPSITFSMSAVPEPSSWSLLALGFAGLGFVGSRRARAG